MSALSQAQPPPPRAQPSSIPCSILITIVDLHPLSWSLLSKPSTSNSSSDPSSAGLVGPTHTHSSSTDEAPLVGKVPISPLKLDELVTVLIVFLNAHLASGWGNEVVVYGTVASKAILLYPVSEDKRPTLGANMYAPFQALGSSFESRLKSFFEHERNHRDITSLNNSPALVSALTKALCHINRRHPPDPTPLSGPETAASLSFEARILVINATPGTVSSSTGFGTENGSVGAQSIYVGMMNCVFAAQKSKVPIDVLTLPPDSTGTAAPIFLQQASYLTNGIYWRWNGRGGLLQYLHTIYLPPPSLRKKPFTCPPQDAVDFRAVCFCHQDVVHVGFVCSVCLSIFCKPLPACQMCKTRFPVKSHPTLVALAAHIQPIPVPDTVPSRPGFSGRKNVAGAVGGVTLHGSGSGSGSGSGQ